MEILELYKSFDFGDKKLKDFKGVIRNEGDDLNFSNAPSFNNEFAQVRLGKNSYYLGTTKENKIFQLSVILIGVTMSEYRQFLNWLNIDKVDKLIFDYNPNYYYKAKVNTISNGTFTVNLDCVEEKTYNVEVDLEFITVNDYAARWNGEPYYDLINNIEEGNKIDNDEGKEFIQHITNGANGSANLVNNHNIDNYYKIVFTQSDPELPSSITIKNSNNQEIYKIVDFEKFEGTIYTEFGFILDEDNEFIPAVTNIGVYSSKPGELLGFRINTTNISSLKIYPISREVL